MIRSWVEVSRTRLQNNLKWARRKVAPARVMAVVKADAYGHGLGPAAETLFQAGVRDFAVGQIEEALLLRKILPAANILVLGGCMPGEEEEFLQHRLSATLFDDRPLPRQLSVHVKVDTGMNRLGIPWTDLKRRLPKLSGKIEASCSHFSSSEEALSQLQRFLEATSDLALPRHICNSAGLAFPESYLDMVRIGLALYGIAPGPGFEEIRPVLTWKTRIIAVQEVPAGGSIGYDGTYTAPKPVRVAVLSVGYADGYNRLLSNLGQVRIGRRLAPIVGRVSMDMISVDVTDFDEPAVPGQEATLLEAEPESPLSAASMARRLNTIPYEVLTGVSARVARKYCG
ncbi:MAG TPA: alanine racemase [Acidobacteriota bacterium]|nr:alanine racemase [Acidobacteriota bacterium]